MAGQGDLLFMGDRSMSDRPGNGGAGHMCVMRLGTTRGRVGFWLWTGSGQDAAGGEQGGVLAGLCQEGEAGRL